MEKIKIFTDEQLEDLCSSFRPKILNLQNEKPKASIVFPAYNEENYIFHLISSLSKIKTEIPIEIIGVNNASFDRTKEIIKNSGIILLDEPKKGLCYARQAGLEAAKGKFILQTDADTLIPGTWVDAHLKQYKKEVVGCIGSYEFIGIHPMLKFYLHLKNKIKHLAPSLTPKKNSSMPPFTSGANFSYLKEIALRKEYGSFLDSNARHEDNRLCVRLLHYGKVVSLRDKSIMVQQSGRKMATPGLALSYVEYEINQFIKFNIVLRNMPLEKRLLFLYNPNSEDLDIR